MIIFPIGHMVTITYSCNDEKMPIKAIKDTPQAVKGYKG